MVCCGPASAGQLNASYVLKPLRQVFSDSIYSLWWSLLSSYSWQWSVSQNKMYSDSLNVWEAIPIRRTDIKAWCGCNNHSLENYQEILPAALMKSGLSVTGTGGYLWTWTDFLTSVKKKRTDWLLVCLKEASAQVSLFVIVQGRFGLGCADTTYLTSLIPQHNANGWKEWFSNTGWCY
jgi:hypothetical protein